MKIGNRTEWEASRKISNLLAAKLRAATATADEEAEYHARDDAEHTWIRTNAPKFIWGKQFGSRSCDELGLMP